MKEALTRRKVLAAIGSMGAAGAIAGAGTTAFFSDSERFRNNEIVAGSSDLKVDWQEHYNGVLVEQFPAPETRLQLQQAEDPCEELIDVPDGLEAPLIDLTDVKPGDRGEVTFSLHACDMDSYLWMTGELLQNNENGLTEPEAADPDENGGEPGELPSEVQVRIWYDPDCSNTLDTEGDSPEEVFFEGSLADAIELLSTSNGIPLDGDRSTPYSETTSSNDGLEPAPGASESRECFTAGVTHCVALEWWLPADHGNEVQTDGAVFDLGFYAEQCTGNDGSGNDQPLDLSTGEADWVAVEYPDPSGGTLGPDPVQAIDPHPAWDTAGCASWVDPYGTDGGAESDPVGTYVYELEFTVGGSPAQDELVVELYGSDNPVEFYLDGTHIGGSGGSNAFENLRSDVPPVGVEEGTHTLRAVVENATGGGLNPTGLLVCARVE